MPTKYKLIAFALISVLLYFIPLVPISSVADYSWNVMSVSGINNLIEAEGATTRSFGVFSGTDAGILGIIYILAVGYIMACLLLFIIHKIRG